MIGCEIFEEKNILNPSTVMQYYGDIVMGTMASLITSLTIVYSIVQAQTKETSKLRATGLCVGNSPGTGQFPAQMATKAAYFSIW